MANRLSAKFSVIALEAGPDSTEDKPIRNPQSVFSLFGKYNPQYFYQQNAVPDGSLATTAATGDSIEENKTIKRQQSSKTTSFTTGRLLGGGTSINGQQCIRGTRAMWDIVSKRSSSDLWSFDNVTRAWKLLEQYHPAAATTYDLGESKAAVSSSSKQQLHGFQGSLSVRQEYNLGSTDVPEIVKMFVEGIGAGDLGSGDYNVPRGFGAFERWQLFQEPDGARCSSAVAFLHEALLEEDEERDLTLVTDATVLRILFDPDEENPRAIGVEASIRGHVCCLFAKREVILCAGIYSAEILQRSGVGPQTLLESVGVPVIVDNPHVGRHLQNHVLVSMALQVPEALMQQEGGSTLDRGDIYLGGAMLPSPLTALDDPDRRGFQLIGSRGGDNGRTFSILAQYNQPHSEGVIQIQSADPLRVSLADNNYFGNPLDLAACRACYRAYLLPLATKLEKQHSEVKLLSPSRQVIDDDDALNKFILGSFFPAHHWTGANRMSTSIEDGVVNFEGLVFGCAGLRVVDCSIAPVSNDGNTSSQAFSLAAVISEWMLATED
jgi:choline dehydrogenase